MKHNRHVVPVATQLHQQPVEPSRFADAVVVPLWQAIVTGLFTGLVVTVCAAASTRIQADGLTVFLGAGDG